MKKRHRLAVIGSVVLAAAGIAAWAEKGKLDRYELKVSTISPESMVLIKTFSTENTDLGSAKKKNKKKAQETAATMVAVAPPTFTEAFINRLTERGVFESVDEYAEGELPENCLLVEGEFTVLNPGSRGKRYLVGFGAGKSKICVKGKIVNAAGEELANFDHCRSGNIGWFGGRAEGMMSTDIYQTAFRLADFLANWAEGGAGN